MVVSTMLLNRMIDETNRIIFRDPITEKEFSRIMDVFVVDMTLWAQLQDNEKDPTKLSEKLKKAAQWWENLLHASGGKLEIDK